MKRTLTWAIASVAIAGLLYSVNDYKKVADFRIKLDHLKFRQGAIVKFKVPKFFSAVCQPIGTVVAYDIELDAYIIGVGSIPEFSNNCPNPHYINESELTLVRDSILKFSI
jgi:hypothetical protein